MKKLIILTITILLIFTACTTNKDNGTTNNHSTEYLSEQQSNSITNGIEYNTTETQNSHNEDRITDTEIKFLLENSFFIRKIYNFDNSIFKYDDTISEKIFSETDKKEYTYYRVVDEKYSEFKIIDDIARGTFASSSKQYIDFLQGSDLIKGVAVVNDELTEMRIITYIRPIKRDSDYILTPDNYKIISNGGGKAEIELYYHEKQGDELIHLTATVRFVYTDDMYAKDTWQIEYEDYLM